jgi:hypothetical protein
MLTLRRGCAAINELPAIRSIVNEAVSALE